MEDYLVLQEKLREQESGDDKLLRLSYSKMDVYLGCPYRYKLCYVDQNYSSSSTLPLEIGTLCHHVLELKGNMKQANKTVDYDALKEILFHGCDTETEKNKTHIKGVNELKKIYWEEWGTKDNKSGMNYDEKIQLFLTNVLPTRMEDPDWEIIGTEIPFSFVYDDKVLVTGFIDRVDRNKHTGEFRITDYKTSKAVYDSSKIKTPLQHIFYDMAILHMYGVLPVEHVYDFILIDQVQNHSTGVCTKDYLKRGIKKIDKTINSIYSESIYKPSPTPLCYWCPFHSTSPNADPQLKGMCQYHSLWTPENKNFGTLNPWSEQTATRKFTFDF